MGNTNKSSILIVDDEKTNLDVLNHIVSQDYDVYLAKSGIAALKLAAANKPDLILLDIVMPEMNGYEVLARLKEFEQTSRIPVIFITGLDSAANEEKGLVLGAVDYITKPFSATIVKARLRTHMGIVRQTRTIESLGMLDLLTALPNRQCFDLCCRIRWLRSIREKTPLGLLFLESAGTSQNESLVRRIAHVLKKSFWSRRDVFLAHLEKARFGLLLSDTDAATMEKWNDEVRELMRNAPLFSNSAEHLTLFTGIASITPTSKDSLEDLVTRAEQSLLGTETPESGGTIEEQSENNFGK